MKIQELLSELGAHIGIPQMALEKSEATRLTFNDRIHVDLEAHPQEPQVLVIHTVLGAVPPEERQAFYLTLLKGNYLARETGGNALSVDPSTHEVVLWRQADAESLEVEALAELLASFVHTAQDWAVRLQNLAHDLTPETGTEASFASMIRV